MRENMRQPEEATGLSGSITHCLQCSSIELELERKKAMMCMCSMMRCFENRMIHDPAHI